jgi:hypothetical protein
VSRELKFGKMLEELAGKLRNEEEPEGVNRREKDRMGSETLVS